MNEIAFYEKKSLACSGANDYGVPEQVEGTLLVATENSVGWWYHGEDRYGYYVRNIFPAVHNGKKCFMVRDDWSPSQGCSAQGRDEKIISFEEGVKELIANGCYKHLWENNKLWRY